MSTDEDGGKKDNISDIQDHPPSESAVTEKPGSSTEMFDPEIEARVRRKIDTAIVPLATLMFLFCFIDRANIGNARLASFEADLGLKGNDYNAVNSIFYISYILCEIPSNILCKYMGPGWFLPIITILFGIVSIASAWVSNYSQLAAVRFLLGMVETGLMPGLSYYMSRWYRRSELTFRLSMYISAAPLSGAVGGLLASGILRIQGFGPFPAGSWRTIFVLEGIVTVIIGLVALAFLADRPETARFLTEEEKTIAINRVRSERVGTSDVVDKLNFKKLWKGAANPVTAATAITFLLESITVQGLTFFAPTIVKTIFPQASVVQQQLLTVPPYIFGVICILATCYSSWKFNTRQLFIIITSPAIIIGYLIFLATRNSIARYIATFLIASSAFTMGPLCHSQAAANVSSDSARNMAIAVTMFFGNIGSLISTWAFQSWDGPDYHIGNGLNFATSSTMMIIATLTLFWMKWDNNKRDRSTDSALDGLSQQEIEELEWKHPEFRWMP
ncbi:MFS transporter [Thozetella sp. PMI_491]|nr:MFS transporter [Thozetella sp. PMI_491]